MRPALALLAVAAGAAAAATPVPARRTMALRYTPEDVRAGRYQYVPFDVPEGTTRLNVEYRYDRLGGANVVDLGLMEPGPLDLGTRAMRGWTGGERWSVTLTPHAATPGYWPGPLPAGRWHAMLGLYKVAEAGVDVELRVEAARDGDTRPFTLPARPAGALRAGPAWYSGGLHLHTVHSDGTLTVAQLVEAAREAGLDFVAITDHNNTAHQLEAVDDASVLRIVGEEVTTPGGHANVWGLGGERDVVDFRVLPGDGRVAELVAAAHARGALFAINHPTSECLACDWTHPVPEGVDAIEVSNLRHDAQARAVALWDRLLRQGRRITAVGTSDWHRGPLPIGTASVRVWAPELSERAVLDAIKAGRVVVMADGRTPPPVLTARCGASSGAVGDTLPARGGCRVSVEAPLAHYRDARVELSWNGEPVAAATVQATPVRFDWKPPGPGYLRVHVSAADGAPLALTNPIYFR